MSRGTGWGVADQVLSSGTNFVLLLITVRSVDVAAFGAFSLVYLLYVIVIPLARASGTVPLTVRHGGDRAALGGAPAAANLRFAWSAGIVLGAGCLASALLAPSPTDQLLAALGVCLPLLLVQDAVRGVLFARAEFGRATLNDAVWAVVQFGCLGPLLLGHDVPVLLFLLAWSVAGCAAGVFGLIQLSVRPAWRNPLHWLREYRELARPLLAGTALTIAPAQLVYLLMPAVASLTALGQIRGTYVLFGPLNVAFTAAATVALPHGVRSGPHRVRPIALRVSAGMGGLALGWALLVLLLPAALGERLLPGIWAGTGAVRLPLSLSLVAEGVLVGPTMALSALQLPARLSRVRYVTGPLTLALGLVLAARYGASGVALAFLIGYSGTALAAWLAVPVGTAATPRAGVPAAGDSPGDLAGDSPGDLAGDSPGDPARRG